MNIWDVIALHWGSKTKREAEALDALTAEVKALRDEVKRLSEKPPLPMPVPMPYYPYPWIWSQPVQCEPFTTWDNITINDTPIDFTTTATNLTIMPTSVSETYTLGDVSHTTTTSTFKIIGDDDDCAATVRVG